MKAYIFIYNVVAIKANLAELFEESSDHFILIGSDYCLNKLSADNQAFFHHTHRIERNFHQVNINEVEAILLHYLTIYQPHNIVLLTNEDSTQLVCAQLREKYGIPGHGVRQVLPYVNKVIAKNKLVGHVNAPQFVLFDKAAYQNNPQHYLTSIMTKLDFPLFIKPIDLVSSLGTFYIPDKTTLHSVLDTIFQEPWDFEIDTFINGELFHCDLIVSHGNCQFFMAGHYANSLATFSKGRPMGSIPVNDNHLLSQLKHFSETVIHQLGVFSSAFHIEIFQEHQTKKLVFLEAASRTPGALVPEMYERMFNLHLEKMHYLAQLNSDFNVALPHSTLQAGWITYPKKAGCVKAVAILDLPIAHQVMSLVKEGEQLESAQSLLDSACSVLFWDKSYHNVKQAFLTLKNHQPLVMK